MSATPAFKRVIEANVASILSGVNTSIPGRIESYDEDTGLAVVHPMIPKGTIVEGERQVSSLPDVCNVPCIVPGSGGRRLKYPIKPGHTVLLIFSSASLDRWIEFGREVDPGDDRRFALTDGIAITGLENSATDAPVFIEFTEDDEIHAGGNDALALNAALSQLRGWILDASDGSSFGTDLKASLTANPSWPEGTTVLKGE